MQCTSKLSTTKNRPISCPHINFEEKHMDYTSKSSVGNANAKAKEAAFRRDISPTKDTTQNTIFMTDGEDLSYVEDIIDPGYCRFEWFTDKYDCTRYEHNNNEYWTCMYKGKFIAYHSIGNGHYASWKDFPQP